MENKQRQIAYKVRVSEILKGEYIKKEGWEPNYVIIGGDNVSRINILAIIIAKTDNSENVEILIDDKTGKISVRTFNAPHIFDGVNIGDVVLLVGIVLGSSEFTWDADINGDGDINVIDIVALVSFILSN